MKNIFILALFTFSLNSFFTSCDSKKDNKTVDVKDTLDVIKADTVVSEAPVAEKGVKLVCKDLKADESFGNPQFDVYLSVDGVLTKIKTILQCSEIPREEYERYQIPKAAVAACGGWYGGGGDYYYVIMRNGKPVVFEGYNEERQEDDSYHWKEIVVK